MKKIKLFLYVFFLSALVRGQGVTLKIHNRTGCELDSVVMGRTYIGHIAKDSVKVISKLKELTIQGEMPLRLPAGIADGIKTKTFLAECATKSKHVKSGTYLLDLMLYKEAELIRLYWMPHDTLKTSKN